MTLNTRVVYKHSAIQKVAFFILLIVSFLCKTAFICCSRICFIFASVALPEEADPEQYGHGLVLAPTRAVWSGSLTLGYTV